MKLKSKCSLILVEYNGALNNRQNPHKRARFLHSWVMLFHHTKVGRLRSIHSLAEGLMVHKVTFFLR